MRTMLVISAALLAFTPLPAAAQNQDAVGRAFNRPACSNGQPVSARVQQANLRIVRSFVDRALGQGDGTAFDEFVADKVWVSTGLKPGAPITTRDEWRNTLYGTFGKAISNATQDVVEMLPTVDGRVVVRFVAQGDHTGEIEGVAPTGRRLTLGEMHLFCVRDGRIVEDFVGGLNPLQWEMIYAPVITRQVLPQQ